MRHVGEAFLTNGLYNSEFNHNIEARASDRLDDSDISSAEAPTVTANLRVLSASGCPRLSVRLTLLRGEHRIVNLKGQ